ncbi:D-alanyl-D-alanine carboxypeptidase [Streptomyces similanensis]|uniref:D-alanyl-D-alanine carboxypeptidase n=1 Tax=Streptomyces similanensis TaxID=1274988 RepID=A0ABP9L070_9ACTN
MAGESPDRSKQRESSAEPTSGSAGPVPGARSEARDARDPRLALAGESGTSGTTGKSGSADTSERRGGVDTATRVLSVRELKTAEDTETSGSSEKDTEGGKAGAAGEKAADAAEDRQEPAGDAPEPETAPEADGAGGSGDEDERDDAVRDDAERGDEPEAADADEPKTDAKADAKADATDDASPVAAPVAKPDAKTGGAKPDAEAVAEPEAKAAEAEADAKKPTEAKPTEAKSDSKPEAKTSEAKTPASKPEPASAEPAPESASDPAPEADPEPPVDQPTAIFKAPKPPVDQPTTMLKLGGGAKKDGEAGPEDDGKAPEKAGGRTPEKDGGRTPEKDGGTKAGAKKATGAKKDAGPDGKSAPESEAERTSKFVALKHLDDPATRKPQTTSQPKAEPDAGDDAGPKPKPDPQGKPKDAPGKQSPRPKADVTATTAIPAAAPVGPERTTQQPLPPKPPLDLLAELTNTPPPPQTPLRTTVRRVKIWTPLVLLLLIVFAVAQAMRPLPAPGLQLTAKESYTFGGGRLTLPWPGEGQGWMDVTGVGTMGHFGKQTPVAIGSVAKTMTAYVILRDHPLKPGEEGPKIKVDPTAEKEGGYDKTGDESTLNTVKAGDFLTEKQALSAVMIPSANNIARLLARWDSGSEAAFVKKMNATAKELGMTNSTYTDPSGLTKTTVSTAEDQVKLGNAAVRIPAMVAITSVASWTDPSGHNWPNYNELPYRIGAIGFKTGTTTAAGGNLLFASRKKVGGQTVTIVGAILGQHKGPSILATANEVSKTALLGAQDALTSAKILKKGDVVGYVDDRLGGHTPVVLTRDVTAVGWAGSEVKLSFTADAVPHSAKAGTKVGTLTVGDGGAGSAIRVPVALQKDLAEPGFTDKLTRIS